MGDLGTTTDYAVAIDWYHETERPEHFVFVDTVQHDRIFHVWVTGTVTQWTEDGFQVPEPYLASFLKLYFIPACLPTQHGQLARLATDDGAVLNFFTSRQMEMEWIVVGTHYRPALLGAFHLANFVREDVGFKQLNVYLDLLLADSSEESTSNTIHGGWERVGKRLERYVRGSLDPPKCSNKGNENR